MTTTVEFHARFHAPAARLFEVLFGDVRDVQRYTQAPAKIEAKAGGAYSIFDGAVTGVFKEISVARTALSWRLRNWPADADSEATVTIVAKGEPRACRCCCCGCSLRAAARRQQRSGTNFLLHTTHRSLSALQPRALRRRRRDSLLCCAGDNSCEVSLTQVRVPLADAHDNGDQEKQVLQGWRDRIFGGIQKFVGIAMEREED
jgi:hypothetical protein